MRRLRSVLRLVVVVLLLPGARAAGAAVPEYELKAEFLGRFARFVEWPAPRDRGALVIGIVGENPFADALEPLEKAAPNERPIEVREVAGPDEAADCQILFIASSERERVDRVLEWTAGRPVLTVGDTAGFAEQGVVVNFYEAAGRVRFEINERAAERSGLVLSSRLLKLARIVRDERGEER